MMKPTIHLNGTSQQSLAEGYEKSVNALRVAQDALCAAAPNGRDYYPQGDSASYTARDEHQDRLKRTKSVIEELEALWESIQ